MIYKTLTSKQTDIWLGNLSKIILLLETHIDGNNKRFELMNEEYQKKYRTGFFKFLHDETCSVRGWTGEIMGSESLFIPKFRMTYFNEAELMRLVYVNTYDTDMLISLKRCFERWNKYASTPFQIQESDLVFYQEAIHFHKKSMNIAKKIGMDYEAFNLDEDC